MCGEPEGRDSSCDENLERSVSCPVSRLRIQGRGPPVSRAMKCVAVQVKVVRFVSLIYRFCWVQYGNQLQAKRPSLKSPDFSPIIFEIFGWFISRKRPKVLVKKSMSNNKKKKKKKKKKIKIATLHVWSTGYIGLHLRCFRNMRNCSHSPIDTQQSYIFHRDRYRISFSSRFNGNVTHAYFFKNGAKSCKLQSSSAPKWFYICISMHKY